MKHKKILPLAVALAAAATVSAGAVQTGQTGEQALQRLCAQYSVSFCGRPVSCPTLQPDQTPDTEQQPEAKPEQTPDTEQQPETKPEQTPDAEQQPETKPEQTPEADSGVTQGDFTAQVVQLVNAARAENGLSALTVDAKVQQAAQVRAAEQAQSFSHTRPNGASAFTALAEAGVSYRGAGENIAYGQTSPQAVMTAWMNSSGHRANILNANFTTIGVGYTVINGTPYWAQLFTY